ncbi:MAG: hypothetical protein E7358_01325 [Clostridiales bacterium]|nr:hypothetical protein [Clostridiales bacterium]
MFEICLIFSGVALFLNGFLPLIKKDDNGETIVMNVISGIVIALISIYGIFVIIEPTNYLKIMALMLLAFLHLYISASHIFNLHTESLGWFSALIFLIYIGLGIYFISNQVNMLGWAFIIWSIVFLCYFISRGLNACKTISNFIIMLEGLIPFTLLGIMILLGITAL